MPRIAQEGRNEGQRSRAKYNRISAHLHNKTKSTDFVLGFESRKKIPCFGDHLPPSLLLLLTLYLERQEPGFEAHCPQSCLTTFLNVKQLIQRQWFLCLFVLFCFPKNELEHLRFLNCS